MQILFVSLGCDKNLVDTEMMLGQLAERAIPLPMMRRKRTLQLSTAAVLSETPRKRASTRFCSLQNGKRKDG